MFVSATFYRLAMDLYWITPVPFHITKSWPQPSPAVRSLQKAYRNGSAEG